VLPLIVVETLISPFKFWHEGIHQGMLYRNDFYEQVHQFAIAERMQAYAKALKISNGGFKVCITVSKTHYTVWVELRSRLEHPPECQTPSAASDSNLVTA
jgi:hypothetical protein